MASQITNVNIGANEGLMSDGIPDDIFHGSDAIFSFGLNGSPNITVLQNTWLISLNNPEGIELNFNWAFDGVHKALLIQLHQNDSTLEGIPDDLFGHYAGADPPVEVSLYENPRLTSQPPACTRLHSGIKAWSSYLETLETYTVNNDLITIDQVTWKPHITKPANHLWDYASHRCTQIQEQIQMHYFYSCRNYFRKSGLNLKIKFSSCNFPAMFRVITVTPHVCPQSCLSLPDISYHSVGGLPV